MKLWKTLNKNFEKITYQLYYSFFGTFNNLK